MSNTMLDLFDNETKKEVSTKELDGVVELYKLARDDYDKKKAAASEANRVVEDYEKKLLEYLHISGKSKYYVENLGTISTVEKLYIATPKDNEAKELFFKWVESEYGKDGLLRYQTVNSQSLNSLFKLYKEEHPEVTSLPGLGEVSTSIELRFTKKK